MERYLPNPSHPDPGGRLPNGPMFAQPVAQKAGALGDLDWKNVVWQSRWSIPIAVFVALLVATVMLVLEQPTYRAFTTLEFLSTSERASDIDPQAVNYTMNAVNLQTQLRILASRSMLNRIVERVNMEMPQVTPPANPSLLQQLRIKAGKMSLEPSVLTREAVVAAASTLRSRTLGSTRIIEISCESTTPDSAAAFANATASEFINNQYQSKSASSMRTTQWLESQLAEAKSRIEQAEAKLKDFIKVAGAESAMEGNNLASQQLRQLQGDLGTAQSDRIAKQTRYELLQKNRPEEFSDVDASQLRLARAKLASLKAEKAALLRTRTEDNYKVVEINSQISQVEAEIEQELNGIRVKARNDYLAAVQKEKSLLGAYSNQSGRFVGGFDKAGQFSLLQREVDQARAAYNSLQSQLNQTNMASAAPSNNIRVIDPAVPNPTPVSPKPVRDLMMASAIGVLLGLAYGSWREFQMLRQRGEYVTDLTPLSETLHLPQLGAIPKLAVQQALIDAGEPSGVQRAMALVRGQELPPAAGGMNHLGLVTFQNGPSLLAESFRQVWMSIFMGRDSDAKRVVVVTSPGAGEGKTTVASNLAIATAEARRRVLIIDGDVRKPRLHEVFSLQSQPGLSDLLMSERECNEAELSRYVQTTHVPNLFVMTGGSQKIDVLGPLLFLERTRKLIRELRGLFDTIIIDTSPALFYSDARQYGMLSDGVVFVLRSHSTHKETAADIARTFNLNRIPILGVVLNDWEPKFSQRHYYYSGHYGYQKPDSAPLDGTPDDPHVNPNSGR